ncbi:MAG: LPS export ABC transporter periplasmic protein LptC [Deltaproteobacteria bacterium]|nr:LPS export ABC transporter periplasmic protein LptC [Deltaproteobacteria bacterium]
MAFIAASIGGIIVLVFIHYKRTGNSVRITFTEDKKVGVKVDKVHYAGTKSGRMEWELDADSAVRSRDGSVTVLESVRLKFYPKTGGPSTLKAREGRFSESTGEVEAIGSVVVETDDGYRLTTERLKYMMKTKELTTKDHVEITSKSIDLAGDGLFATIDDGKFRLSKNVKAVFKDGSI